MKTFKIEDVIKGLSEYALIISIPSIVLSYFFPKLMFLFAGMTIFALLLEEKWKEVFVVILSLLFPFSAILFLIFKRWYLIPFLLLLPFDPTLSLTGIFTVISITSANNFLEEKKTLYNNYINCSSNKNETGR